MIHSIRVNVVSIARSADRKIRQSLSERFMSIQIDNAPILILERQNESSNVVDISNSERLFVQLDLIGRLRETVSISLGPSLSRSR